MAEGDGFIYDEFKTELMKKGYDLSIDPVKISLHSSVYVPNLATHTVIADVGNECAGTGYTAAGAVIANPAVTKDVTNHRGVFDGDDVLWSGLGALSPQPAYAVAYDTANNKLIAYWEITTLTNGGDYKLQFSAVPSAILLLS
ncbi:hypothetical protein KA005_74575 [bacterium]|nr:hypothetical protein [bacterium]